MFRVLLCNNRFFGKFPSRYEAGELLRRCGWVSEAPYEVWLYKCVGDGGNHVSATIVEVGDTEDTLESPLTKFVGE